MKIDKYELEPDHKRYKPKNPYCTQILNKFCLTAHDGLDEVVHLTLDLSGSGLRYIEGQSIGIITPGRNKEGKEHKVRLYSIASNRLGDDGKGDSVSLCVRRLVTKHPLHGELYRGVASNYLCDLQVGDKLQIIGPAGKAFALPRDPNLNLILFAAGTGIAPFRAFLDFIYQQRGGWNGKIILFFGARETDQLLYLNVVNNDLQKYSEQLSIYTALSRQEKHPQGGRLYIQHKLLSKGEEILPLIEQGHCSIYICGISGMSKGIEESLVQICNSHHINWSELKASLYAQGKWNVEEY